MSGSRNPGAVSDVQQPMNIKKLIEPKATKAAPMENTKIEYLYRDTDNWKMWGQVVLTGYDASEVERIKASCSSGELFLAEEVGLPVLRETHDMRFDHIWHEFHSAEPTDEPPTNPARTIQDLASAFVRAEAEGWPEARALKNLTAA